jgi:hypothetical protein
MRCKYRFIWEYIYNQVVDKSFNFEWVHWSRHAFCFTQNITKQISLMHLQHTLLHIRVYRGNDLDRMDDNMITARSFDRTMSIIYICPTLGKWSRMEHHLILLKMCLDESSTLGCTFNTPHYAYAYTEEMIWIVLMITARSFDRTMSIIYVCPTLGKWSRMEHHLILHCWSYSYQDEGQIPIFSVFDHPTHVLCIMFNVATKVIEYVPHRSMSKIETYFCPSPDNSQLFDVYIRL